MPLPIPRVSVQTHEAFAASLDPLGLDRRREFSREMTRSRDKAIAKWYADGGEYFVNWVQTHYRRHTGEALRWDDPFQVEAYLLTGCPWAERTIEEKGGQVGYTERLVAFAAFLLSELRITVGYGVEKQGKMRRLVGRRILPTFKHIEPIQQLQRRYRESVKQFDDDSKESVSVAGVALSPFFTSTVDSKNSEDRQVPDSMTSFEAWAVLADEVEAWAVGAMDIARQRQSACTMKTKPFRAGSTPGVEGGIVDGQIKSSRHVFQWRVACLSCGTAQFLHPFGNLLKPLSVQQDDGSIEESFIDITGRPLDWFSHSSDRAYIELESEADRQSKIDTSYVGCMECGAELTPAILANGHFADNPYRESLHCAAKIEPTAISESLRQFCDRLTRDETPVHDWIALRLPRLASVLFSAPERIRDLAFTKNSADSIQQGLGCAISIGLGKLSLPRLLKCVGLPLPEWCDKPDLIILGVDQGQAHHWGTLTEWYFPKNEKDKEQKWLNAHVRLIKYGAISGFEGVEQWMSEHSVDLVGMDHEPEVNAASKFARHHLPKKVKKGKVYLMDQVTLQWGEEWKESIRESQKQKYTVYAIHRTWGLDAVRDRVNRMYLHLPANLIYNPKDPENLLYHFLTSERTANGKWTEANGEPDHLFHSFSFAESAAHIFLFGRKSGLGVPSILPEVKLDMRDREYWEQMPLPPP